MSSLDNLQISDEKKKYITDVLNPVLEEFVTDCLKSMPPNPLDEMLALSGNKGGGSDDLAKENARLKAEMEQLKAKVEEAGLMVSNLAKDEVQDEEEEEDDDDDCDELPESFKKPPGQMSGARASVSAEAYGSWNQKKAFEPPVHPKNEEQKGRLKAVLEKSFLFSSLDEKEMELVIMAMVEKVVGPKTRLINQGEDGDFLFVIEEGQLDCFIKQKDTNEEKLVKTCEPGDAFGELALLYNCTRAASVESRAKCVLWQLDRETFNHIVKDAASKKREKYEAFLCKVPLLGSMDAYERSQVADGLQREVFAAGAQIVQEDDPGDKFFILEEGEAYAEKKGVGKVMDYKNGDYFGELALLRNQPRAATVIAKTAVTVLALPRSSFKRLLGSLDDILARNTSKYN